MTTLFLYVMAASSNPDEVKCVVPYRVDDDLIFFGPCKKKLREALRDRCLQASEASFPDEDIFVVGVNGSNQRHIRKIVWAGRIIRLMTFEAAYNSLVTSEFQEMRSCSCSPLHLKPLYNDGGDFVGYEHISCEHENVWVSDIAKSNSTPQLRLDGKRVFLASEANRSEVFTRDCCFLCENIFFAQGAGIPITDEILDVLKQAQRGNEIDAYALFGYCANRSVNGLTGRYLEVSGNLADSLIYIIRKNSQAPRGMVKRQIKPCKCR